MSLILATTTNPGSATWTQSSALGVPLASGRTAASSTGPGNAVVIPSAAVTSSNVILFTIESSTNTAAGCIVARSAGVSFTIDPTTGFTGFVNWVILA